MKKKYMHTHIINIMATLVIQRNLPYFLKKYLETIASVHFKNMYMSWTHFDIQYLDNY